MIYYTSIRPIDGKSRKIIVDEAGNIVNRTPHKDELRDLDKFPEKDGRSNRRGNYSTGATCDRCRERGKDTKLCSDNARRERNKDGIATGRWICKNCYYEDYSRRPDCGHNIEKSLRNHRTGNQDPNCNTAKGDSFEELTCRWRSSVSITPVENLNKKLDNCRVPIDHSSDSELGIIQTKGRLYDSFNRSWGTDIRNEHGKEFDYLIFYCANKDGTLIERIYIFPKEEIEKRKSITIYKNPTNSKSCPKTSWYDVYRTTNEETIKEINETWEMIIKKKNKHRNK